MRRFFRPTKLKLIAVILALTAVTVAAARGSVAFFTDSKESAGVFTAGNVYIELTEAATKRDSKGNLIADPDAARIAGGEIADGGATVLHNYGVVFPGQTICKDPTITNVGDDRAWIAAKVIIEDGAGDIHRLFQYSEFYDEIDIELLLSGGLLDEMIHVSDWNGYESVCHNDRYAMIQIANHSAGRYEFYFLMLNSFAPDESVMIFDTLSIHPMFGNAEMQEFRDLKVTVQAFAVQTFGFSSCLEAMTEAFPEHFVRAGS